MNTNTSRPPRLTVVSAGLSVPSSTRLLADRLTVATREQLADAGHQIEVRVVELRDLAADIANNLVTGFPSPALEHTLRPLFAYRARSSYPQRCTRRPRTGAAVATP